MVRNRLKSYALTMLAVSVVELGDDSNITERTQHPVQRRSVRLDQVGDLVQLPRSGGQRVRDAEPAITLIATR